jgi:prolyl-tRNA synthetase
MKFSQLLIPTTKETPNDASLASHIYLIRAGFIQSYASGLYNFLPLGKIVLDRVRAVIKDELDKAGAMEVSLGFVTPSSFWKQSGRIEKYGKELLRFKDRKNADFVLSPTNEESMVNLVKNSIKSYKNLPLNLYQINLKFRDEIRPRFGLMRGREFLMKDGYSFHANKEDMIREFNLMEKTYSKIFTRLGLDFRVVEADSGAIGGSGSKEFMVLADSGEDTIVVCSSCEYGANIEAGIRKAREIEKSSLEFKKVKTTNITTIDELSIFLNIKPTQIIKAIIKKAIFDNSSEIVIFFIRGDDTLEERKACNSVDANELVDVSEEEIKERGLSVGYVGCINLPKDIKYIIDLEIKDERDMVIGANEDNYHIIGANLSELKDAHYADLIAVQEGDKCPYCGSELKYKKGIEVGHIFQLGTQYSKALDANFLDNNGKTQPFVMGTYGIGVSRLLAGIIEQNHDDRGCIWTAESTPFSVEIIISNIKKDDEVIEATKLYNRLISKGIRVLLDDRKDRFGVKIKDFELIGIPTAVIIGKKLNDGLVEIVDRKRLEKSEILLDNLFDEVLKRV